MWGISRDYKIVWVSPALAHLLGREVDDMLGRDFREFVCDKQLSTVEEGVKSESTKPFRQWVKTPLGARELCITPVWADYQGTKARYTHMVPVGVGVK